MSRGYICIAQNTNYDYLRMAYLQALSCKLTQTKENNFSIVVDKDTFEQFTEKHFEIFDNVILLEIDSAANSKIKQQNESQIFRLSPYKQTIKTEADMLFTHDYSWIWDVYNPYVMNFTKTVYTYDDKVVTNRSQRRLFDDSLLPNIYSAWTYFTYDKECNRFYNTVNMIIDDWDWYRDHHLINCRYDTPRTDEVYALAHRMLDIKTPNIGWGFVHMKPQLQNLPSHVSWLKQVPFEIHNDLVPVINYRRQTRPLHYVEKTFVTDELLDRYEYEYANRTRN